MALHACSNYKNANSNEIKGLAFAHFSHTVRAENLILLALENNLHLGIPNKPRIVPTTILYLHTKCVQCACERPKNQTKTMETTCHLHMEFQNEFSNNCSF